MTEDWRRVIEAKYDWWSVRYCCDGDYLIGPEELFGPWRERWRDLRISAIECRSLGEMLAASGAVSR